jgi:hypothetical protein
MGIDHKKTHTATSASFCVRSLVGALIVCGGLLGVGAMAHADSGDRDGPQRRDDPRGAQMHQQGAAHSDQRAADPRASDQSRSADAARQVDPRSYEARAEEQRRAMQEATRNAELNRRVGRLTPDERRDLRRQINEVGQDIYANPPRR